MTGSYFLCVVAKARAVGYPLSARIQADLLYIQVPANHSMSQTFCNTTVKEKKGRPVILWDTRNLSMCASCNRCAHNSEPSEEEASECMTSRLTRLISLRLIIVAAAACVTLQSFIAHDLYLYMIVFLVILCQGIAIRLDGEESETPLHTWQ